MALNPSAARRTALRLSNHLSPVIQQRLGMVLAKLDDDGRASLGVVLELLYPEQDEEQKLNSFRMFRSQLKQFAEEAKIAFELCVDTKKRTPVADRRVWLEGEDSVREEMDRVARAETENVQRTVPQSAVLLAEDHRPMIRYFVSYAHDDQNDVDRLLNLLQAHLDSATNFSFHLWRDTAILPGEAWREEIEQAMAACDFGLLLVSPAFLGSKFIQTVELPALLPKAVPVALHGVRFDGKTNLRGLEEKQFFQWRNQGKNRHFTACASSEEKRQFADALFGALDDRAAKLAATPPPATAPPAAIQSSGPPASTPWSRHHREHLREQDVSFYEPTEGELTSLDKLSDGSNGERRDALEFLHEWLADPNGPPYAALLGEYGMGKTTTCRKFALDLLNQSEQQPGSAPAVLYLDLRLIGGDFAKTNPTLDQIVEQALTRSWKAGAGEPPSGKDVLRQLTETDSLVIADGLDEVLVHLPPAQGQTFTREIFRVLPPAATVKQTGRRVRLLLTCRTHYFRTLRDQRTHFTLEDRDGVEAASYRALLLLPFSEKQIRDYLAATLPDGDRAFETIQAVHNLAELAGRPYTLDLIRRNFAQIERWRAEGRIVTGLTIYRHMALSWLERDTGKHTLTPDHKQAFMQSFAAALHRSGRRDWKIADVERELARFLAADPLLDRRYRNVEPSLLEEDLRTATFLVREGEDGFRFAHSSLQEFFLAGYLHQALVDGRVEDWAMPMPSIETLDFVGQWLTEDVDSRERALATLGRIRDAYRAQASELGLRYALLAHEKGYPVPSWAGASLAGAQLAGWEIRGKNNQPFDLSRADLTGANLLTAKFRWVTLDGATLSGADGRFAEWLECRADGSTWQGTKLEGALFRRVSLRRAGFDVALCNRTQVIACEREGIRGLPDQYPAVLLATPAAAALAHRAWTATDLADFGHGDLVWAASWSPDGARVVTGSYDKTAKIWDAATGACVRTLACHGGLVMAACWSPDGARVVTGSEDKTAKIWDAATGACVRTLEGHGGLVIAARWSPDGARVVTGSSDKTAKIWDAATGACVRTLEGHGDLVWAASWSPDGARVVTGSHDDTAKIWDWATGACVRTLEGHGGWVRAASWSPDGARVVTGSSDQTAKIWDAAAGACVWTLAGHSGTVWAASWSPDGARVVTGSHTDTAKIWDAATGACVRTLTGHVGVCDASWSPDGARVVTGSHHGTAKIWDAATGACVRTLAGHGGWVNAASWSPDGARVVTGLDDHTAKIWDAATGACVRTLAGHRGWVRAASWSPDGARVVTGSDDRTAKIWDAATGACVRTLEGYERWVMDCGWSPDGARVVTGLDDDTAKIWDVATGTCLETIPYDRANFRNQLSSPDGQRRVDHGTSVASVREVATDEELVRLIHLPDGEWASIDCRTAAFKAVSPGAWRYLGWNATHPETGERVWLPAETFGPLPVVGE